MAGYQDVMLRIYANTSASTGTWIFITNKYHQIINFYGNIQYRSTIVLPDPLLYSGTKWNRIRLKFASRGKGAGTTNDVANITWNTYDYSVGVGEENSMDRIGWIAIDGSLSNS